jgi:hypothetical protein
MLKISQDAIRVLAGKRMLALIALWGLIAFIPFAGLMGNAFAASLQASEMPGFGRIILSFESLPMVEVTQVNGVLVLNFDRPVDFDPNHLGFEIPNYISSARLDPDKRAMRFAIAKSLRPNLIEAGNDLYLDLLPTNWKGPPPTLPVDVVQALSRKARNADAMANNNAFKVRGSLNVEAATSARLSRLIFRGANADDVKISKSGKTVELTYSGQWNLDIARIRTEFPRGFEKIDATIRDGNLVVTITALDGAKIDARIEDNGIIIDVTLKGVGFLELPIDAPNIVTGATLAETVPARNRDMASEPVATKNLDQPRPKISLSEGYETLKLLLSVGGPIPIASFMRSHRYWLVLDTKLDPELESKLLRETVRLRNFRSGREGAIFVISFELPDALVPDIQAMEEGYQIEFLKQTKPDTLLPLLASVPNASKAMQLGISLGGIGHIVEIHDPVIGDRIIVVPSSKRGIVNNNPLRFAEFSILQSGQGIAVVPIADDLEVKSSVDLVTISRPDGLALNDISAQNKSMRINRSVINRARWERDQTDAVLDRKAEFIEKINQVNTLARKALRLDYARFLAANGLYREAAAGFQDAFNRQNEAIEEPRDRIEVGIYQALGFDWRVANENLSDIRLSDQEEAVLWRGFIAFHQGRFAEAVDGYRRSTGILDDYPVEIQSILNRALAEAAIESSDWALAADRVNKLGKQTNPSTANEIDYFKARIEEASGNIENARSVYERLTTLEDRSLEVRATAALTALDLRFGKIDANQALSRYEKLANFWRGDFLEAKVLAAAARVALDSKKWQNAFSAVQRLNRLYADTDGVRPLLEEVTLKFDALISGDQSEGLSNLDAVALFMEFKEFMPVGHRGDELIRKYIERLVDLDLISQATQLLRYQIDYRLEGIPRAAAAVRLAGLYLLEHKPIEAVRAIYETRFTGLSDELKVARRLIEAQARSELGEIQVASELLEGVESREATILRGDIFWKSKNWNAAGTNYEIALGDVWRKASPLTPDELKIALRASAAYVLSGDKMSSDRFGRRYKDLVSKTPDAGVFQLLAAPTNVQGPLALAVADEKSRSGFLDSFLKSYRVRYGLDGSSDQADPPPAPADKPAG